jgi:hypothetical protein
VAFLHVKGDGSCDSYLLDLSPAKELGPYVCFWEFDFRVHFAWAAPNGRDVHYVTQALAEMENGLTPKIVFSSPEPLLWLDAYRDTEAPVKQIRYLQEYPPQNEPEEPKTAPPPPIKLWAVGDGGKSLSTTRVNTVDGAVEQGPRLDISEATSPKVISSAVTHEFDLSLLMADEKEKLFYSSTKRRSTSDLAKLAGKEIKPADCPTLVAAHLMSLYPWVHLRYIDNKNSLGWLRLEPAGEKDPIERGH